MDIIKMLWEKIYRESEGTWRYEVFRDNIEKHIPKESPLNWSAEKVDRFNRWDGKESITPINGNEYRAEEPSKNKIVIPHGDKEEVAEKGVEYGLGYAKGFIEGQKYYKKSERLQKKLEPTRIKRTAQGDIYLEPKKIEKLNLPTEGERPMVYKITDSNFLEMEDKINEIIDFINNQS